MTRGGCDNREHDLVGHVPRYRMVRFGGYPTQVEGARRDTVKNL